MREYEPSYEFAVECALGNALNAERACDEALKHTAPEWLTHKLRHVREELKHFREVVEQYKDHIYDFAS